MARLGYRPESAPLALVQIFFPSLRYAPILQATCKLSFSRGSEFLIFLYIKSPASSVATVGLADLARRLSQLQSPHLSSIAMATVDIPWKAVFVTKDLLQLLPSPRGNADFMRCREPLKQILIDTRDCWDHAGTRPAVRENFNRVINCRTPALGAEIFASTSEEKLVYHTCKSRACSSCGHGATLLWQREQWASLPDIRYAGIVFTMPEGLWSQQNRHLLHDLPALGARSYSNG
jgi:hypothetical protein